MKTLKEGKEKLRVLFYGQSITAQNWRRFVKAEIRQKYPNAKVEFENLAIGGFESPNLRLTAHSDLYPYYPDLLIFHVYGNSGYFEEIIRNTREKTSAEIVLWDHHVAKSPKRDARDSESSDAIAEIADKYDCMFIDVRAKWKKYLKDTGKKPEELLIDGIHLNRDGEKLLGDIISAGLKRTPEYGENEFAEKQIQKITLDSPLVKKAADGTLTLNFDGNKVIVVSDGSVKTASSVLLDGKKPSVYPEQWVVSRTSQGPKEGVRPAIKRVEFKSIPVEEDWTITCLEKSSPDGKKVFFKVHGSVTGDDGTGVSTEEFISNSGRVKIDKSNWNLVFPLKRYKIPLPKNFKIKWRTYCLGKDTFSSGKKGQETVLVQNIKNGKHKLAIKPSSGKTTGIAYFKVYTPTFGKK